MGPSSNVLGVAVPLRLVLARTEDVAVAVVDATAYPTGLEFRIAVRRRGGEANAMEEPPFPFHPRLRGREIPPELLRFGVQFSDGRKATSLGRFPRRPDEEPSDPVLLPRGGGGGGGQWDFGCWLYPLPPPGSLTFVCEWPSEGIELTRVEIDASLVLDVAERAEVLWEDGGEPNGGYAVSSCVST
jgi:hypothetical protein